MSAAPFSDRPRVDAFDKVRGATKYAADMEFPGLLYAVTVPARIAKGTMTALSTDAAMRVLGVVRVLTPGDFPPPPAPAGASAGSGQGGAPPPPLGTTIAHRGQLVALVVAETLEAAIEGAEAISPVYTATPFTAVIDDPGLPRKPGKPVTAGNAAQALAGASTVVSAAYESPAQHHNSIEMLSTTAVWSGGRLTIHEGTQNTGGIKAQVARTLGLKPEQVDVKSPSVGGGFGQKASLQQQTPLAARAAMLLGRPVKVVMPRGQIFHTAPFRPRSRHTVELGADSAGRMVAVRYAVEQQQSRTGRFPPAYHGATMRLYGIDSYLGSGADIPIDTQGPGYMRAPWGQSAFFALESAVDELAHKLGQDPVALRVASDGRVDPLSGLPYSSRHLNECLTEGARRFGWSRRPPVPRSMTAPDGTLVGWGVGCGAEEVSVTPAIATLRVSWDGHTRFAISGHEMGQGMRTAIAAVLLRELAIDEAGLDIVIGDTTAAPQHMTAASWGTASTVPVALEAATRMRTQMAELLDGRAVAGNLHQQLARVRRPSLTVEVSRLGPGQGSDAFEKLRTGQQTPAGPEYPGFVSMSYIAHFVEVRIDPRIGRLRVPRVVSIVDCGRVVSPGTAASQVRGGVVWGIGATIQETSEVDPRYGGFLNADLADYVVPVNADIGEIDVGLIDQPDPLVNTLGTKSLGTLTICGVSAAIANAVFHATGKRQRRLPIRTEDLL